MDELIAFVNRMLDEDEAGANEVHRPRDCGCVDRDGDFDPDPVWCGCNYPARVLREIAAKRAIMRWHPPEPMPNIDASRCPQCELTWPCPTIRVIVAVWSDNAGYGQEWKP